KGVMLTHRNLVANILQADGAGHCLHDEDVTIAFLPFFHIYGITAIALLGLWSGVTLVVMPKFELEAHLDLVERHRPTLLHVVPPVVVALPSTRRSRDGTSRRSASCSRAPRRSARRSRCNACGASAACCSRGMGSRRRVRRRSSRPSIPLRSNRGRSAG